MSIVKNTPHILKHCRSGWTNLQNQTIDAIKDAGTLGVYVFLASKSENWEISETNLQNRFGKGRDYIRARLADLKHIGLLKTHAIKGKKGRIIRWETVLYNEIQNVDFQENLDAVQITENPHSGKPRYLVDPPTTKERSLQKKDFNKTPIVPKGTTLFDSFWELYPMKKSKKKALAIWTRENLDTHADVIMEKLKIQVEKDDQWKQGYIPNPTTYLHGERWLDEITKPKPKTTVSQEQNRVAPTEISPEVLFNGFIQDFKRMKKFNLIVPDSEEPKFKQWEDEGRPTTATAYAKKYNLMGVSPVSKRP